MSPWQILKIIHFNDCYEINKSPQFLDQILKTRDQNTLLLFSGDLLSPSLQSQEYKGFQFTEFFKLMNIDFGIVGNHDLDYGADNFILFQSQFSTRWVMSNLSLKINDKETYSIKIEPIGKSESSIIIEHLGYKIGFIGLVDHNFNQTLIDSEKYFSPSQIDVGLELSKKLKEQGCDLVIALTHMLNHSDELLQRLSSDIDLILGGHDHCYLLKTNDKSLVLKSGSDFNSFTYLELSFVEQLDPKYREDFYYLQRTACYSADVEGLQKTFHFQRKEQALEIKTKQVIINPNLPVKNQEYLDYCLEIDKKIMDECKIPFFYFGSEMNILSGYIRTQEMPITKLWADIYRVISNADIAASIGGHLRSEQVYEENTVFTKYDFNRLICIKDSLIRIEVPGWKLKRFFEQSYYSLPQARGGLSIPSDGVEIELDLKWPHFNWIVKISYQGEELQDDRLYSFCSLMYSISGKEGYTWFDEIDLPSAQIYNEITESLRLFNLSKNKNYWKEFWDLKQIKLQTEDLFKIKIVEETFDEFDLQKYIKRELQLTHISHECMKWLWFYSLFVSIVLLENNDYAFEFLDQQGQRLKILV